MFANELLRDKLCLEQESQQKQFDQMQDTNKNDDADFTFDNYIPKQTSTDKENNSQVQALIFDEPNINKQQAVQHDQIQQESEELQMLKDHILKIQSIAMKEIQGLKKRLQEQVKQKQSLKQKLQELTNNKESQVMKLQNEQMLSLLKEENKMLKTALKKQLQINKNLIKNNIFTQNIQNQSKNKQTQKQQQNYKHIDKENNPLSINQAQNVIQQLKQFSKVFTIDRPAIPMPIQNKKPLRI